MYLIHQGTITTDNPYDVRFQLKSHKISFTHNSHCNQQILLEFCTEHDSHTAVLCAKFQNDSSTEKKSCRQMTFCEISVKDGFRRDLYIVTSQSFYQQGRFIWFLWPPHSWTTCWSLWSCFVWGSLSHQHIGVKNKMANILQTTFCIIFSWMRIKVNCFEFHQNLFLWVHLMISQQWCGWWLGAKHWW